MAKRSRVQTSIKSFFSPVESGRPLPEAKRPKATPPPCQTHSPERVTPVVPDRDARRHSIAQRKLVGEGASWSIERDAEAAESGNVLVSGTKRRETRKYTPLEQQVVKLKAQYPGVVLIIEVGYKMRLFGEDADIASKCCNIYSYPDHNFMTASFPVPRLPIHVRRLVENGNKVGVVRQVESAAAKAASQNKYSVFERKLVSMHTRATLDAGEVFEKGMEYGEIGVYGHAESNQLLCVVEGEQHYGMVAVESCAGDVRYGTCRIDIADHELWSILLRVAPQEVVIVTCDDSPFKKFAKSYISSQQGGRIEMFSRTEYLEDAVVEKIAEFYGENNPGGQCDLEHILSFPHPVLVALCAAKDYLEQFNVESVLKYASSFEVMKPFQEMQLSGNTLEQLEILQNSHDGGREGSLLHLLDQTRTLSGRRLLRYWLCHPLTDMALIRDRHDAVEELITNENGVIKSIPRVLGSLPDLEKGLGRVLHKTASPAECVDMLQGFQLVCQEFAQPKGLDISSAVSSFLLNSLMSMAASPELFSLAQGSLRQINVVAARDNDFIDLFHDEDRFHSVFAAKKAVHDAEQHLKGLLPELARQVRLHKVTYMSVANQGDYLIEVPSAHNHVPATWGKVCGTKKVDRYHPPEVKEGMLQLDLAKDKLMSATKQSWLDFLSTLSSQYATCRSAVRALAALDVLHSFALIALSPHYTRPRVVGEENSRQLVIEAGRHPILDTILDSSTVVANDTHLTMDGQRAMIITGPNMGGKSCYIKLVALTVIMAQVGSFVPAASVSMHAFDAVFTRMGASDNLHMGKSTFLEELSDTSTILSTATDRTLVVVDELGRGTSTFDGVAIAQATLELLVNEIRCFTCFVTHYPEVARMEKDLPGKLVAYHMSYACVSESRDRLTDEAAQIEEYAAGERCARNYSLNLKLLFLYKLVQGAADHSFGLNVARMAGLPQSVIRAAKDKADQVVDLCVNSKEKVELVKEALHKFRVGEYQPAITKQIRLLVEKKTRRGCKQE